MTTTLTFGRRLLASMTLLLALGSGAGAQEPGFSDTVEVRVFNLEVVVTDGEGNRVRGLRPEDFELKIDGKVRPVDYFSEVADGLVAEQAAPLSPGAKTPPAPPALAGARPGTNYLIFADLALGKPWQVDRSAQKLADGLAALPPGDRVALRVFDGHQLLALTDWDDPREKTIEALRDLQRRRGTGTTELADQRASDYFRSLQEDFSPEIRERLRRFGRRITQVVTAATTSLRTASPPPGRRVMITLSGAWPRNIVQYVVGFDLELEVDLKTYFPTEAIRTYHETANLLGYTLYTVDLEDQRGGSVAHADTGDADAARENFERSQNADYEADSTLQHLAEETGGQAMTNGLDRTGFEKIRDDLASFYWLGSQLDRRRDDGRHKVEVRALRPGLEVRYRRGFRDLSRKAEVEQEVESHLLFARSRADDFPVTLGKAASKGRELLVPASLRLPLDRLSLLPKGKEFAADLELRIGATDERGKSSDVQVLPIQFAGPAPAKGQYVTYDVELRLRPNTRRVVLALYDKNGDSLLVSAFMLER